MNPFISIQPNSALIDTSVKIKIKHLQPYEAVTLKAHMYDNLGTYWASSAKFEADAEGVIDLETASPLSGTYEDADARGLFWSMQPIPHKKIKRRTPLQPLETTFTLEKGSEILATSSMKRHLISPEVNRQSIREQGLIGTFFYHSDKEPKPTIIVLGGSEGGLREGNAALLASYGFNTLALAYFGVDDLPTELTQIPIDNIERAIHWLSQQPDVNEQQLGIMGTSKGGELALLCASMFSELKAVVGYVPSSVVYQGISRDGVKSSWTYRDREIPFAQGNIPRSVINHVQTETNIIYRDWYLYVAEGEREAEIPVENIQGPVLLISGGDDQLWPADVLSERAMHRLRENRHPYAYEHLTFPQAGHAFGVPGLPTSQSTKTSFFQGRKLVLGGHPKENAAAQHEAWDRMKVFFTTHLK